MPAHLGNYLVMLPLLGWIVWRRVNRTFGWQPIQRRRMLLRIGAFALLGALLALGGLHHIALAEGLLGGVLVGAAIGLLGLQLTRFQTDPLRGDGYLPNPWIGALLTALLLGRLAWRFTLLWPQLQAASGTAANPPDGFNPQAMGYTSSPLTMLVIGLLIGYYIAYFSGLLIHHRRFQRAARQAAGTAPV